jgi:hypothetical protein
MGWIDSEMIFIVAPKAVRDEKGNLPKGFRHGIDRRFMTFAIVAEFPLRALYRILTLVAKFMHTRVNALVDKLNLPRWMSEWFIRSLIKGKRLDVLFTLSQNLSLQVRTLLNNLLALTVYFRSMFLKISKTIGKLSTLKNAIQTVSELGKELSQVLKDEKIAKTFEYLKLLLVSKLKPPTQTTNEKEEEQSIKNTFINNDISALDTLNNNSKEQPPSSPLNGSLDPPSARLKCL